MGIDQNITNYKNELRANTTFLESQAEKGHSITYTILERFYSFALECFFNKVVDYNEIYEFLSLLKEAKVNNTKPETISGIRKGIDGLKQRCIKGLCEDNLEEIVQKTTNHLNNLYEKACLIVTNKAEIDFQEYEYCVKFYSLILILELPGIDFEAWRNILLGIRPRCRTCKELDKTVKLKESLNKINKKEK